MSGDFTIRGHGLAVPLPTGWDGAIYRRAPKADESTYPVLHAATFGLPSTRGDFGGGAVELMGRQDVFLALVEFDPAGTRTALFAHQGIPQQFTIDDFSPTTLQRMIPGQAGVQRFFSHSNRAFCMYVVLGAFANATLLAPRVSPIIQRLEIPASGSAPG